METTVGKLLTGVEVEVGMFGGKEQSILTALNKKGKDKTQYERLYAIAASVTKRVGDTDITEMKDDERDKFFKSMLFADIRKILVIARDFTWDEETDFIFNYGYLDEKGNKQEKEIVEDISQGFPEQPFRMFDVNLVEGVGYRKILNLEKEVDADNNPILKPAAYSSYAEVLANRHIFGVLPKTGIRIRLSFANYNSMLAAVTGDTLSSNSRLMMNNPCKMSDANTPVSFSERQLEDLPAPDLEYMRAMLKVFEGRVHTECQFDNPEYEFDKTKPEKVVRDLINEPAFYFPSQAI